MVNKFRPDVIAKRVTDINSRLLGELGIKGLILDIDNTIAKHVDIEPSNEIIEWFKGLKTAGIKATIVTNSSSRRAERFGGFLEINSFGRARKPTIKTLLKAMIDMGTNIRETAVVGDQIFADVMGAKNAGMLSILVEPIAKWHEPPQVIIKRVIEKPLIRIYKRRKDIKFI